MSELEHAVEVRIVCQVPSKFADAARHGGKCNWSVRSSTLRRARIALRLHQAEQHGEVKP